MHETRWLPPEVEHIRPDKRRAKSFDDLPQNIQPDSSASLSMSIQFFNGREHYSICVG